MNSQLRRILGLNTGDQQNASPKRRTHRVLPGFNLSLGYTISYLSLIVLIPLAALFLKSTTHGWEAFWSTVSDPRVIASLKVTFGTSLAAATVNLFFGALVAWVLVRYRFPGKKIFDALVDLPFALPTAVAGITLTTLYAGNGWIGQLFGIESFHIWFLNIPNPLLGIKVAYTPLGIVVALTFVTLPFVVRTVQPVLEEAEAELEEAAASLGANRWQTVWRVVLPGVLPALMTGFSLAFARAIGEYGSVIFIAGNLPMVSEITPLIIVSKLEQYDYAGATAVAVVMLVISFILLLVVNTLQGRISQNGGR